MLDPLRGRRPVHRHREAGRHHYCEDVTDDIVYPDEVGALPDDVAEGVGAAESVGWHAVLHRDAAASLAELEALIAAQAGR